MVNSKGRRKGSFLEKVVGEIFERSGFNVKLNDTSFGFEIDVLATKNDYKIIIECKQYDSSYINIPNLLHLWESKGRSVNADKVVVVVSGQPLREKDFELSKKLGVYLIDEETIHRLNNLDRDDCKSKLNHLVKFDEEEFEKSQLEYGEENKKNINILTNRLFIKSETLWIFTIFYFGGLLTIMGTLKDINPEESQIFGWLIILLFYFIIVGIGYVNTKRNVSKDIDSLSDKYSHFLGK